MCQHRRVHLRAGRAPRRPADAVLRVGVVRRRAVRPPRHLDVRYHVTVIIRRAAATRVDPSIVIREEERRRRDGARVSERRREESANRRETRVVARLGRAAERVRACRAPTFRAARLDVRVSSSPRVWIPPEGEPFVRRSSPVGLEGTSGWRSRSPSPPGARGALRAVVRPRRRSPHGIETRAGASQTSMPRAPPSRARPDRRRSSFLSRRLRAWRRMNSRARRARSTTSRMTTTLRRRRTRFARVRREVERDARTRGTLAAF